MSSQESDGESHVSHTTANPRIYGDVDPYGWSSDEEVEADLKRMDSTDMEEEETSLPQPGDVHVEFKTSSLPNTVKPPNTQFISYRNLKKSVAWPPSARMHPWVDGALTVTGKLRKETMDLKCKVHKLEEENHILRASLPRILHHHHRRRRLEYTGMGTTLGLCQAWGRCPGIVSPSLL
jgi:hypothetical protein